MYQIPDNWKKAKIIPVFEKGDRTDCNNIYREISMLNSAYKSYTNIVTRRLNTITEVLLQEEQHGFRGSRSCAHSIFIIQQSMNKRREFHLETNLPFIDNVKAFDGSAENYGIL
jgi:hypothetical protein